MFPCRCTHYVSRLRKICRRLAPRLPSPSPVHRLDIAAGDAEELMEDPKARAAYLGI